MSITANGRPVISGSILMPRSGVWTADLIVDDVAAANGAVTIAIDGGPTLVGTATRGGPWQDTAYFRVRAGAGAMKKTARPKYYRSTTVRTVLTDLLRDAGETLSSTADQATLATSFPAWTTVAESTGDMVSALLADSRLASTTWRMLADGTLWIGPETWPDAGLKDVVDFQELARLPHEGRSELGFAAPSLLPGTILAGRRVSYVEHSLKDDVVRTMAWFEDA